MPKDTVERAVKRGSGAQEGADFEEVRYEGYGPGGVAVMVDCMTDNRNRTVAEVRHAFTKCGGNLGAERPAAYRWRSRSRRETAARAIRTRPGQLSLGQRGRCRLRDVGEVRRAVA